MNATRIGRLIVAGSAASAVTMALTIHAKGDWYAPKGTLMRDFADENPGTWVKSYHYNVTADSIRNGLVSTSPESNLATVHKKALFDRFLLKSFTSEVFMKRRVLGVIGDPTATEGLSYCPPGFVIEKKAENEVLLREGNSPLCMYVGVIENKPQYVGDPHTVSFNISVSLSPTDASWGDKVRFISDIWVARRYLSDGVRITSKAEKVNFFPDRKSQDSA
eukprot:CFRG6641T1